MKKSGKLAWTAMGLTVIAFDVAGALVVAPLAMDAVRERHPRALIDAGKVAAHRVTSAFEKHASRAAGEGLIVLAKGASRIYGVMLSVTPEAEAEKAAAGGCSSAIAPAVAEAPESECAKACRRNIETATPVPARFYSQTL